MRTHTVVANCDHVGMTANASKDDDNVLCLRDFGLRNESNFNPPPSNRIVEAFTELLQKDVFSLKH